MVSCWVRRSIRRFPVPNINNSLFSIESQSLINIGSANNISAGDTEWIAIKRSHKYLLRNKHAKPLWQRYPLMNIMAKSLGCCCCCCWSCCCCCCCRLRTKDLRFVLITFANERYKASALLAPRLTRTNRTLGLQDNTDVDLILDRYRASRTHRASVRAHDRTTGNRNENWTCYN